MPAPQRIKDLVENFKANFDHIQSPAYKEEDVRTHFLNPFFEALGWDMEDKAGKGPRRDVKYEEVIKSGAPDFGFYTDGKLRFFVEAKNPSVDVCNNPVAAMQLRGYGWSAKVALSILTDFEELSIYDTTVRPKASDKAHVAKLDCIKYTDFVERWDEIADMFSREAVLAGSLEKREKKRAKQAVDEELLVDISTWRDLLAHNIANRNTVTEERLNRIVQDTISRILFLRICEDRGIAPENTLQGITEGDGTYAKLYKLFKKAESRYDSDLFEVDTIADLNIDDKPLKEIISELYFPKSPYKFDAIPAEILGQVYEQFLGKVIRLTEGGHAKVEEKPEVRKAGGIYYTPTYIVEYIVQNTVGKLVEGKTPKKIETLSIVDPACGSGSFLLGAYKFLADWYRDWYVADGTEKHLKAKKIYLDADKQWQLTLDERKRILIAHIYGVDLDRQAVEMAKLSLMLEALRAPEQQSLFNERMLPRMADNIKCGNALIGTDYFAGKPEPEPGERGLINPFDWDGNDGFAQIMNRGGFDLVIGNPPYVYRNALSDSLKKYYAQHFISSEGNFDLYKFFIERGISVLRPGGTLGFIVSSSFLILPSFEKLRKIILSKTEVGLLAPLGPSVFSGATVDTAVLVLEKTTPKQSHKIKLRAPKTPKELSVTKGYEVSQTRFLENPGHLIDYKLDDRAATLVAKLFSQNKSLESLFDIGVGINTGFIREELVATEKKDNRYHPMIPGNGISRYGTPKANGWIMYDREFVKKQGKLGRSLPEEKYFDSEKILIVRTRNLSLPRRIISTLDNARGYNLNRLSNIISKSDNSLKGLLGILNSQLLNWLYSTRFFDYEIKPVYLRVTPCADVNDTDLIGLVEQMLGLHAKWQKSEGGQEQTVIQRQVDAVDKKIDLLVYKLYGLTDEEVRIVEEATN